MYSELRPASILGLGDLKDNTERLRELQSFETIFDVGCIFPAQYLHVSYNLHNSSEFLLKEY